MAVFLFKVETGCIVGNPHGLNVSFPPQRTHPLVSLQTVGMTYIVLDIKW